MVAKQRTRSDDCISERLDDTCAVSVVDVVVVIVVVVVVVAVCILPPCQGATSH